MLCTPQLQTRISALCSKRIRIEDLLWYWELTFPCLYDYVECVAHQHHRPLKDEGEVCYRKVWWLQSYTAIQKGSNLPPRAAKRRHCHVMMVLPTVWVIWQLLTPLHLQEIIPKGKSTRSKVKMPSSNLSWPPRSQERTRSLQQKNTTSQGARSLQGKTTSSTLQYIKEEKFAQHQGKCPD